MRGSYLMRRYIAAAEATRATGSATGPGRYGRSGKPVSRRQIARLTEIRIRLEASRSGDTVEAALRELVAFALSDICAAPPPPPRAGDDVSLYTISGRRGRTPRHAR